MRLIKVVQFGFGLAVAGGTAVVISGSAMAAETTETSSPQTTQVVEQSSQSVVDSATTTGQTPGVTGTEKTKAQPVAAPEDKAGTGTVSQSEQSKPVDDKQPAVKTSDTDTTTIAKVSDAGSATPKDDVIAIIPSVHTNTAQPAPVAAPALMYHSSVLPIQPVITSHQVLGNDLAASMPSAPVAEKMPVPAKSSGVLGKLGLVLAGVVVPQSFTSQAVGAGLAAPVAIWLILLAVLALLFVSSYGAWLRRGGFATAARSDVPAPATSNLFATPLLLSYVPAPPRQRSSLFGVANWFLTLSERRNCI
jgi:hypothetical protein